MVIVKRMIQSAKFQLSLIDLTSLNEDDTAEHIERLCRQAVSIHGKVAAVCVYPQYIKTARQTLDDCDVSSVAVATVVNFPSGEHELTTILQDTQQALADGATEIDLVLPYNSLFQKEDTTALTVVSQVAEATHGGGGHLKVIIESGALENDAMIAKATEIAILGGGDFVKTSTGKIAVGATPEAVEIICATIIRLDAKDRVGIKVSGGIRTMNDAAVYLEIIRRHFGEEWIKPDRVRLGSSSLLSDIYTELSA